MIRMEPRSKLSFNGIILRTSVDSFFLPNLYLGSSGGRMNTNVTSHPRMNWQNGTNPRARCGNTRRTLFFRGSRMFYLGARKSHFPHAWEELCLVPCLYKTECGQEVTLKNWFLCAFFCRVTHVIISWEILRVPDSNSIISFIMENLSDQGLILLVRFKPRSKEKMFLTTVNIIPHNKPLRK